MADAQSIQMPSSVNIVGQPINIGPISQIDRVVQLDDLTNHSFSQTISGNQSLTANLRGAGTFRIQIRGIWSGTIFFEQSIDNVEFVPAGVIPFSQTDPTGTAAVSAFTVVNGNWIGSAAAFGSVRVRASLASGSADVFVEVNHATAVVGAFLISDGLLDHNNSTDIALGANETFLGVALDLLPFTTISVNITSDQDSAAGGLSMMMFSADGADWDFLSPFQFKVGHPLHLVVDRRARYFRLKYVNGPIAQTKLHIQTICQRALPSIPKQTLSEPIETFRTAILNNSVIAGRVQSEERYQDVLVDNQGRFVVIPAVLAPNAATESTLATRLKPGDTINAVLVQQGTQSWRYAEPNTTQTGFALWTPASGKKIAVTSLDIIASANILLTLWFGASGDTTFTLGTDQPLFRGMVSNGGNYLLQFPTPRVGGVDQILRLTTSANGQVYVLVYGNEV